MELVASRQREKRKLCLAAQTVHREFKVKRNRTSALLSAVILLSLTACNGSVANPQSDSAAEQSSTPSGAEVRDISDGELRGGYSETEAASDVPAAEPTILPSGVRSDGLYLSEGDSGGYFYGIRFQDKGTACGFGIGWKPTDRNREDFVEHWSSYDPHPCGTGDGLPISSAGVFRLSWTNSDGLALYNEYSITSATPEQLTMNIYSLYKDELREEVWSFLPGDPRP